MYNKMNSPFEFYELTKKEQRQLLQWCGRLNKIETINHNEDSYTIKHDFERSENGFYVNNGAMKGAMMQSDFECYTRFGADNMNFNVSQKSLAMVRAENNERSSSRSLYS